MSWFNSNCTLLHHEGVLEPRSVSCRTLQMQSSFIYNITFIAAVAPHSKSSHTPYKSPPPWTAAASYPSPRGRVCGAHFHFFIISINKRFPHGFGRPLTRQSVNHEHVYEARDFPAFWQIFTLPGGTPLDHYCTLSAELVTIIVHVHFIEYLLTRLNLEVIFGACLESN